MIYIIHGKDTFRSNLELQKLISKYKDNSFDIIIYDFDIISKETKEEEEPTSDKINTTLLNIKNNIEIKSLFKTKKLIVIKNVLSLKLPKKSLNLILKPLEKTDETTSLVFFEKTSTTSLIPKEIKAKILELKELKPNEINKFIDTVAIENNLKLSLSAKNFLSSMFSSDLGLIYNEILKLSNYKKNITDSDILDLINAPTLSNVFALGDAIAQKNKKLIFKLLLNEVESKTDIIQLYGLIISQFRNLIILKESEKKRTNTDIHPYVVRKLTPILKSFDLIELKKDYASLFKYDLEIKKGRISPQLAIELFVTENL